MFSNCKIELRTYKCKNSDLWEGWNNFVTRGRSGKVTKKIPYLDLIRNVGDNAYTTCLPYNPQHYLNIAPPLFYGKDLSFEKNTGITYLNSNNDIDFTGLFKDSNWGTKNFASYSVGQSALPSVMYAKIAKEFQNPNLLQDNPNWYPENENHDLILSYECTKASNATYGKETYYLNETHDDITYDELYPTNDNKSMPWLNVLYFKQRRGDYFNTASPFPNLLRGDVPTLEILNTHIDASNILANEGQYLRFLLGATADGKLAFTPRFNMLSKGLGIDNAYPDPESQTLVNGLVTYPWDDQGILHRPGDLVKSDESTQELLKSILEGMSVSGLRFSMNEWRRLATMTVFRERMARSDGSYNQMIMAQFRHNPNWHEHGVVYCGGSTQPVVFSEVVQQSESSTTPLGTTAGRAFSNSTSREIYVKADDYSIVMTVYVLHLIPFILKVLIECGLNSTKLNSTSLF